MNKEEKRLMMTEEEIKNKFQELINDIPNLITDYLFLQQENKQLKEMIDKATDKLTLLIDIGFDYDGFNTVKSLKELIDELIYYARDSRKILKGETK